MVSTISPWFSESCKVASRILLWSSHIAQRLLPITCLEVIVSSSVHGPRPCSPSHLKSEGDGPPPRDPEGDGSACWRPCVASPSPSSDFAASPLPSAAQASPLPFFDQPNRCLRFGISRAGSQRHMGQAAGLRDLHGEGFCLPSGGTPESNFVVHSSCRRGTRIGLSTSRSLDASLQTKKSITSMLLYINTSIHQYITQYMSKSVHQYTNTPT